MKKSYFAGVDPKNYKKILFSALSLFLMSAVLMISTSYAWLVLSVAPEVTGITTNVAANGSLEIALLTTSTRQDMSTITSGVGQSLVNNKTSANLTWGNLLDLHDESYGLSDIVLLPARLNLTPSGDGYKVEAGMLSVPTYGYDGRIVDLTDNTVSAVKGAEGFTTALGVQDYGVRAVGTSDTLTAQASSLSMAKANVATYTNNARNSAISAMRDNGSNLLGLLIAHSTNAAGTYDDSDLKVIRNMVDDLEDAVSYIDNALRQGLIAVAASAIGDEDQFILIRDMITSAESISALLENEAMDKVTGIPDAFMTWVTALEETANSLNLASNGLDTMVDGDYTWDELKQVLNPLMNMDQVYVGEKLFNDMSANELAGLVGGTIALTLAPGSGVMADIADFTGNYESVFTAMGSNVTVSTASAQEAYLVLLYAGILDLSAADGGEEGAQVELSTTYGYALDLAFRTNAPTSNLLLQTSGVQRVYSDSGSVTTLGGGSYMEFSTQAENYTLSQMIQLMDAVRVGFLDDQGNLLGVAKLNTSNRTIVDQVVTAPLYLYEFTLSTDPESLGAMVMGERMKLDNTITELQQSTPKAITVLVWLDGDVVDNSMVAADAETSLTGTLNLQFASSADLVPMGNGGLKNLATDKTALDAILEVEKEFYEAGQLQNMGTAEEVRYSTVSWNHYVAAYDYAATLSESLSSNDTQVYWASLTLAEAKANLVEVDISALEAEVAAYREKYGTSGTPARYLVKDANDVVTAVNPYTMEQYDNKIGTIYRLDPSKNTDADGLPIYTDASWNNLAAAIYDAELLLYYNNALPLDDVDAALTAVDTAEKALERNVLFEPYVYQESIYYFAITDPENKDTYGKWYDGEFKRVVSDLMILKLDAEAVPASIASILQSEYVLYNETSLAPALMLEDKLYPELANDEIIGVSWNLDSEYFTQNMSLSQKNVLESLEARWSHRVSSYWTDARDMITAYEEAVEAQSKTPSHQEAQELIELICENVADYLDDVSLGTSYDDPKIDNDTEAMSWQQRTVLTVAVGKATELKAYTDEEDENHAAVVAAVEAAQEALAQVLPVSINRANALLNALNAHLSPAVTEYNTIQHYIPGEHDTVYTYDTVAAFFSVDGTAKDTSLLQARVITKNGVVFTASKSVIFYKPVDYVEITGVQQEYLDGTEEGVIWDGTMLLDEEKPIFAVLGEVTEEELKDAIYEKIKSCTWASSNTDVITVSGGSSATVKALKAGTAELTLSVTTDAGNVYTTQVTVTVTAPVEETP